MPATTRRIFLGGLAAATAAQAQVSDAPKRRPNILFALADDWGWPFASIAGDPVVKTPTFDRLAREGVLFTNAFVTAPSCSPSRVSMLTGQWHWRLEEGVNLSGTLAPKFPVYPDLLEAAGYHVGYTRKGWAPGNATAGGRTRNPAGPVYSDFQSFLSKRKANQPFCFWFGSTDPHRKYDPDSGVRSGMRAESVKVPAFLPDSDVVRRDLCDYYFEVQRFDREVGELLEKLKEMGELGKTIVVMTADNGCPFPRAKATLYDSGTHVPLAISWPGEAPGGRTIEDFVSLSDMAPTFLEAAGLKVPESCTGRSLLPILRSSQAGRVDVKRDFVLTGMERHVPCRGESKAGYPMRAIRTHDFLYIRNFAPERWPAGDPNGFEKQGTQPFTFEQMAGNTFHAFADVDAGPSKAWLVEHREDAAVASSYRLAMAKRPAEELYDLAKDPNQLTNVGADPKYAAQMKRLRNKLLTELNRTGDLRVSGKGDVFESYPYRQRLTTGSESDTGSTKPGNAKQ
ncbi:MAG: sulfatase [Bryobacteraceae bacterium]|nr:sulfatase [Bryobacteraceae bacterium]